MRTTRQQSGDAAEEIVAAALSAAGWTILGRQVRVGRRELDIIAIDPGPPATLVFVEVRWRRERAFGLPEETVDWRKRSRLREAAWRWLANREAPPLPARFDLIVVEPGPMGRSSRMRHHRAAF